MAYLEMTRLAMKWAMKHPPTTRYPFMPRKPIAGSRGQLVFDKTSCTHCTACAKKCPTDAILVNRQKKIWAIDRLRCISCGYCVEVCPKDSLKLTEDHGDSAVVRDRGV
jgi:ech hydrogenase subunit F